MTTRQITEMDGRLDIVLTQAKTDTMVAIPIDRTLEPLVRERMAHRVTRIVKAADGTKREVETTLLVPSPHGKLWSRRNASRAWDHDMAAADNALRQKLEAAGKSPEDIEAEISRHGEQRRDLRRTASSGLPNVGRLRRRSRPSAATRSTTANALSTPTYPAELRWLWAVSRPGKNSNLAWFGCRMRPEKSFVVKRWFSSLP